MIERISKVGALPCFCEQKASQGNSHDKLYPVHFHDTITREEPICKLQMQYSGLISYGSLANVIATLAIIIQSFVARAGFIKLSKWVKFQSQSGYMRMTVIAIFLIFFF